jgi:nucleotide-binding universal stress UspA family protein
MDVLFATDGRAPAAAAGELLRRLVAPSHVDVTVLHASEFGNELVAESSARRVFAAAEASLGGVGISTHMVFTEGDPAGSIVKELAQGTHHLTVIGAGNHTWLGRLVLGSVSTHVLHESPVPVLVVHRAPDPSHQRLRVLVGADGSPSVAHAIDTLASLTEPGRVEIHLRTVARIPELAASAYPGVSVPASVVEELVAGEEALANRHLDTSLERVRSLGFTADGSVGTGWPANDLLEYGQEIDADLLVVGARGIGVIERLTMGSVSAHVAGHAPAALVAHARAHPLGAIGESRVPEISREPKTGGSA